MTKEHEALKLALEALEEAWYHVGTFQPTEKAIDLYDEARTAIKETLAQPEHGWTPERIAGIARLKDAQDKKLAQRTWVGLTDEEIEYAFRTNSVMVDDGNAYMVAGKRAVNIAQAIEAKLKEKNT